MERAGRIRGADAVRGVLRAVEDAGRRADGEGDVGPVAGGGLSGSRRASCPGSQQLHS